jgi:hypothetical protein
MVAEKVNENGHQALLPSVGTSRLQKISLQLNVELDAGEAGEARKSGRTDKE